MCGIVALFRRDGTPVLTHEIVAMRDSLVHRGPDDAGVYLEGHVGLGHRRLRIIDLAGGRQPMANGRGTVHVVFNGEIYNYRALRRQLEARGVQLHTHSDTETILGLYELYGERCVDHLCGMFAFVLWDTERHKLVAARDRLGIKPLYLLRRGGTVALASEIKALLWVPEVNTAVAEDTLAEYLTYRTLTGTQTMFRDIERLAPGEMYVCTEAVERRHFYWRAPLPATEDSGRRTLESWAEELDDLLAGIVQAHLVSDVPLGTFNSGGVDSSLITAYAAHSAAGRLNTYSVGFDEPDFDERPYAHIVAGRFGTRHHSLVVDPAEYAEWLPRAIWHHDEPLNHPHSVHLAFLSRLAAQRVTVVLTGEGADELFGGYPRYRLPRLLDRFAAVSHLLTPLLGAAAALGAARRRLRMRAVLDGGGALHVERLAAFVAPERVAQLLSGHIPVAIAGRDSLAPVAPPLLLPHALAFDQQTYLQSLLARMDKMSMAASIEGRVPFLDHRIVEFAAAVPPHLKVHGRHTKVLLKRLAQRHLPPAIIDRRKAGFAVPVTQWLRPGGALAEYVDTLLEPRSVQRGYCDAAAVRSLVAEHRRGAADHGELLWALINLELWQRVMVDAASHRDTAAWQLPVATSRGAA